MKRELKRGRKNPRERKIEKTNLSVSAQVREMDRKKGKPRERENKRERERERDMTNFLTSHRFQSLAQSRKKKEK